MALARTIKTVPAATEQEAAAVVAALERFARDPAAPASAPAASTSGWLRAARIEAVSRDPGAAPA
jgi:hypothetical protein